MLSKVSGDHTRKDAKATHLKLEQIVAGEVRITEVRISFMESILKEVVQSIQMRDNLTSHLHAIILDVKVLLQRDYLAKLSSMQQEWLIASDTLPQRHE